MPATGWSEIATGALEISPLVEAALTGVVMTTLPSGMAVEPVTLEVNYFRPTRPQSGNLLARARVVNASRFFTFAQVEIEDPHGRQIGQGASHCEIRKVEPSPPAPPAQLPPTEESTYATPDPYLRAVSARNAPSEMWADHDGCAIIRAYAEGRFASALSELGYHVESVEEGRVVMVFPASESFCQFSRAVAPGAIARFATVTGMGAGLSTLKPGLSFAGLQQSLCFYRAILADGREVRAEATSTRHERDLIVTDVQVFDADRMLAVLGRGIAKLVDTSRRQKRHVAEAKRILATLLFTDIVGSTEHAKRLGDARWRALLEQHHTIVRAHLERYEGIEVDTAGDGFFARFELPARALECAVAVRDSVNRLGIQVRVGMHTGECELQGGKVTGIAAHIAARIQGLALAGEILLSSTVKDLAATTDAHFEDRGQHTLKGLPGEWHLFGLIV